MSARIFPVRCPKCFHTKTELVPKPIEHYVCTSSGCQTDGTTTQFQHIIDDKVRFPYNQIFVNRPREAFRRSPYLRISPVGVIETKK